MELFWLILLILFGIGWTSFYVYWIGPACEAYEEVTLQAYIARNNTPQQGCGDCGQPVGDLHLSDCKVNGRK